MSTASTNLHADGIMADDTSLYISCRTTGPTQASCSSALRSTPYAPLPPLDVSSHLLPGVPGFVDRALVLDGRDVTRVSVEDHRFQHAAHDFSASSLRQHRHEVQLADDRHRTQFAAHRV